MQIWQKFEIKIFLLFLGTTGVSKSFTYIFRIAQLVNDMEIYKKQETLTFFNISCFFKFIIRIYVSH